MLNSIAPTKFQTAVLAFRDACNILNAGGRGSGKSFSLVLDLIDHCATFGPDARPLVVRESWAGLQEIGDKVFAMCVVAFGKGVTRNRAEGVISLPNGALITLSNLGDEQSYVKLQGRTFTALYADEVGAYPPQAWKFLMLLRSNLRVAKGKRVRIHMTANPHGKSHSVLMKKFIQKSPPWRPFYEDGPNSDLWVWTTSSLDDNPHIDRAAYRRQLVAATGSDTKLAEAWIKGDWSVLGGVMFENFDPEFHVVPATIFLGQPKYLVGADFGMAAPSTAILLARVREQIGPMRFGSIVAVGETDTADPADLSLGLGTPPGVFAEQVKEMCARRGVNDPSMVTDDMRGLGVNETVVQIYREAEIDAWRPLKKDRVGTWALIRQLLENAKNGDGPGLYFLAGQTPHLLETLVEAPRGTLRPEDIDPKWNRDHWLDGLAYGVNDLWHFDGTGNGKTIGYY